MNIEANFAGREVGYDVPAIPGMSEDEIQTPCLILDLDALERNIRKMDLSRVVGSFVIARNTAFTYKGKPFDVTQIGCELNVRYVLEGSVQRGGNRLRVNVQLIDADPALTFGPSASISP